MRFKDRIVLVTGGASGLGRASALSFAKEGAKLVIFDIDRSNGPKVVKEIEALGTEASFVPCDMTDPAQVSKAFDEAVAKYGRIDIMHANAGVIDVPMTIDTMSFEQWNRVLSINLNGMFLAAKGAVTQMLKQDKGVIVFTGSNWAYVCDPGFTSYAASKGGVVAFARALALDHARDNIRINVVCPGNMHTPLLDRQLSMEKDPAAALENMGQVSDPQEIANLVLFLASDDASAMKGSAVIIDQGETLGYGKGLQALKK
ncbi:MAG: SDR family oxidoreductase [Treponema sp.]|nr:SDR family oxidoreductase [Treponema sp.]